MDFKIYIHMILKIKKRFQNIIIVVLKRFDFFSLIEVSNLKIRIYIANLER